ncbi:uncharacterized protein KGF55_001925 [Candida pseudojiufengensis]|uniref:uncharacterized protein n=1 Tax=Candida pseudojiufengensis TaxID=497109 RepID=UPI00222448FE|nr:uncharacterized protein KGF55_001925 [Candida pseudojiufengensis]KAI5964854.1 hypothetical protein KGF55_001925 [Candida pseudojiufengensis]
MDINSIIDQYLTSWYPTSIPTTTTSISYINPTYIEGLKATALSLQQELATQTNSISLYFLSRNARAAAASYTILSNQQVLNSITQTYDISTTTTATETIFNSVVTETLTRTFEETSTLSIDLSQITDELVNSTLLLKKLEWDSNLYAINISIPFNLLFTILFIILIISYISIGIFKKGKTKYFTICMILGCILESIGYICRTIAHYNWSNPNLFVLQAICLTVAPALIMASIYYLLSQLIIIYGYNYSIIKPNYIAWIFVCFDVASLFIQSGGGIFAGIALKNFENTIYGTHIMVSGMAFQVLSMSLFLIFLFNFLKRIYFNSRNVSFNVLEFFQLLGNTSNGERIRQDSKLDNKYDSNYQNLRNRKYFNYLLLMILISSLCIYIRCIYRVIELVEGWRGFLITHEPFLLTLDALMVFLGCAIFVPFHPKLIMGNEFNISVRKSLKYINEKIKKESMIQFYKEDSIDSEISYYNNFKKKSSIDKEVHSTSTLSSGTTFNNILSTPERAQTSRDHFNHNPYEQSNNYRYYETNNQQQIYSPKENSNNVKNNKKSEQSFNSKSTNNKQTRQNYFNPYLNPTKFAHYNSYNNYNSQSNQNIKKYES